MILFFRRPIHLVPQSVVGWRFSLLLWWKWYIFAVVLSATCLLKFLRKISPICRGITDESASNIHIHRHYLMILFTLTTLYVVSKCCIMFTMWCLLFGFHSFVFCAPSVCDHFIYKRYYENSTYIYTVFNYSMYLLSSPKCLQSLNSERGKTLFITKK